MSVPSESYLSERRGTFHRIARRYTRWALRSLESAMRIKPGPYPDPTCPIHRWQLAHEHLTAALELLK